MWISRLILISFHRKPLGHRLNIKHFEKLFEIPNLILGVVWKVAHFFFWQNKLDFSETLSQIGFNSTIINVLLEHYRYFTPTSLGKCFGCKKTGRRGQKMSTILIDSHVVYFQHFYLYKLKTKTERILPCPLTLKLNS